jgi:hypothetical protein
VQHKTAAPWILPILIGGLVGALSGLFGVGGGFIMNPLLIMMGVPPAVAVSTARSRFSRPRSRARSRTGGAGPWTGRWRAA